MPDEITIVSYDAKYKPAFIALNTAWLEEYFYVEETDIKMFTLVEEKIIDRGGEIFFCIKNEEAIATAGMQKVDDYTYELCKMAVSKNHQGKGYANLLVEACLNFAKKKEAKKIILYSNTILTPAINLYKKYGFKEMPLGETSYARSNIFMELNV
jgi:ribosomal protein S18 acetylase RimI-like enzyme